MGLGPSGYTVRSFAEIKLALQTDFQDAFGSSIDLSEQSPQGIWINSQSEWLENVELSGLNVYNNLNLNTASGIALDFIAIVRGTKRNDGTQAVATVTLTSNTFPYTIPASTQFTLLNTSELFTNPTAINISATAQSEQLVAVENGISSATISSKFQSTSFISQLTDITATSVTNGTDTETDTELRARLRAINSISSTDDIDSVYSSLLNLSNVQKVTVYENDTNLVDVNGLDPHSINAIVLGDTDQNVADVIFDKKAAGTPTFGSTAATSIDIQGFPHVINFDRPSKLNVYISCTATAKPGELSVNSGYNNQIRTDCANYVESLRIGQDISYSSIYGNFAKYNAFDIVALTINGVSTNVTVALREYAIIETPSTDVSFTVV